MTDAQIEQAEKDAKEDAEWLLLLLLLGSARFSFDAGKGRFYVDGKSVSITTVRNYLARIERKIGRRIATLTDQLEKGTVTAAQWRKEFERNVRSSHILTAALALGSIGAAVRNADVQGRIASELGYADGFAKDVKRGKAGSIAQIKARGKSYLLAAIVTYGILEQKARELIGVQTECRRIRRASESCPGCIAYSYRWMPIAECPPIGSLQCSSRCRCFIEYR